MTDGASANTRTIITIRFDDATYTAVKDYASNASPPMSFNSAVNFLAGVGIQYSHPKRATELTTITDAIELVKHLQCELYRRAQVMIHPNTDTP